MICRLICTCHDMNGKLWDNLYVFWVDALLFCWSIFWDTSKNVLMEWNCEWRTASSWPAIGPPFETVTAATRLEVESSRVVVGGMANHAILVRHQNSSISTHTCSIGLKSDKRTSRESKGRRYSSLKHDVFSSLFLSHNEIS